MLTFDTLLRHATGYPARWSFLGSPEAARQIPQTHQDQIFFLDGEAREFLWNYLRASKMLTGPVWEPLNPRYFRTVQEYMVTENGGPALKKWLYEKPIPFRRRVYLLDDLSGQALALTWKMVIKYCEALFFAEDAILFDESLNWCLYYYHHDQLWFAQDKIYDKEFEYEKARELHALKEKYFNRDNLNFTTEEKRNAVKAFQDKYGADALK